MTHCTSTCHFNASDTFQQHYHMKCVCYIRFIICHQISCTVWKAKGCPDSLTSLSLKNQSSWPHSCCVVYLQDLIVSCFPPCQVTLNFWKGYYKVLLILLFVFDYPMFKQFIALNDSVSLTQSQLRSQLLLSGRIVIIMEWVIPCVCCGLLYRTNFKCTTNLSIWCQ